MGQINIIGCGESGALWDGKGDAIGVNDCAKFGHTPGALVLLDYPAKFPEDRLKVIMETKSPRVFSHITQWRRTFLERFSLIHYKYWNRTSMNPKTFEEGEKNIYVSNTSPFCAISIAVNLGYTELLLYGVDFKTHWKWHPKNQYFIEEKEQYLSFIRILNSKGIKVYSIVPSELGLPQPGESVEGVMQTTYV